MKKFLFLLAAAIVAVSTFAAPVDQAAAMKKAKDYLVSEVSAGRIMAPATMNPVLIKTEMGNSKINQPVYYIYNTSTTYLVVAGDDRAEEILMVGDEPVDLNRIPCGMQYLLDCYKEQISFLQDHPDLQVERYSDKHSPMLRAVTYGPLLTAKWDQDAPYYNQCKFTRNNTTYQCLTGCPATSAAMVMYYWKYPASVGAMASYSGYLNIGTYSDNYVSFTYPALEATTFDWNSMKDTYSSNASGASATAVATLMRYIGQAEKMEYGGVYVGSGIPSTNSQVIATMFRNWGYKSTARLANKSSYSEDAWAELIIAEMAAGRPVVYLGIDNSSGGHAFNVDGYRDSDSKFHVNFGWSGSGNNWYAMNAFSYGGDTFSSNQRAIIGIESPSGMPQSPQLTVEPTSLIFSNCTTGQTYTQTFTVTGVNLDGEVTISKAGSSFISVSPTTLTKAQATAGDTVTVTYAPTQAGNHSATLTVASNGAASKTISVSGTSTGSGSSTTPTLTANPASLSFDTEVGSPVTQTFTLKGYNLTSSVTLSVSGTEYTIDKTIVTKTAANNGIDITVTYNPTSSGTHTGSVLIKSAGAESITVDLNGTATAVPKITVSPTSLSLSTTVGQSVTKTFTVTGSDLLGNILLSCSGTGFSIDKAAITRMDAAEGVTVTVTYNPTAAGNHTGTVTLTSNGAQNATVTLTGTATAVPTLTVNPTSLSFNTVAGTPVTKTFTVTGANLTNNVSLSCSGTGFSIDKTTIDKTAAANGVTVTVTYNPTAGGDHTGSVIVTSTGASSKTVSLSGTATEPVRTITATPTSLNFTAVVGETKTATFNVSGENLTGDLTLTLTGANGVYSISPTTITAAQAMAGNVPVTVTYTPTVAGTKSALVSISGGGAPSVTVSLSGTATDPVRTITASPTALNFVALVGETKTATFNVSGENLTGNLTLALSGVTGVYSISPTTITAAQAMAGNVPVTVTYSPTAFGIQTATVTISGGGAPSATVTLNGQADLIKYAPVMMPAIEEYINLTQFRADWTDATPEANVDSYTLEVMPKAVEPEPEPELIASLSGTSYSGNNYYSVTLTAPWEGLNVHGHNNQIVYFRSNYNGDGVLGYISYTVPAGYENATFTMKITSGSDATEAVGNITVSTPQTAAVTHYFNPNETYAWVVTASSGDKITITTPDDNYSPDMALIEVYSGNATVANLRANETVTEDGGRLITGITDKFYTVENLLAEGTFLYRVKALYIDGTESDWSNIEEVTLFQNGHGYNPGDVNHDGVINITDVTALINGLLTHAIPCEFCADVNGDSVVNITDVTSLINMLLSGGNQTPRKRVYGR